MICRNKFSKSGKFSAAKKRHQRTTIHHAIHHKLTTKNHAKNTLFLKNPLQKRHSTTPQKSGPAKAEPPNLQSVSSATIGGRPALRVGVKNLFPHNLIQNPLPRRLGQRNRQNILNPAGVVKRHTLRLIRR